MEIIFHSSFFYGFFRMVSFPPMRHLERGYLPVWVVKLLDSMETLGREIS